MYIAVCSSSDAHVDCEPLILKNWHECHVKWGWEGKH